MKLALLAVCVGAFLAVPSIAAAATPQGKLTGSATLGGPTFAITTTVIDGGTNPLYIGKENDYSGNCEGDSGTVVVDDIFTPPETYNVVCAHFVASSRCCNIGSPKMRLAIQVSAFNYTAYRITDNGDSPDTWAVTGAGDTFATARAVVNKGRIGSALGQLWFFAPLTEGNFTVTP